MSLTYGLRIRIILCVPSEMQNDCSITISTGNVIKGIALLMMVFHHCYGVPRWLVPGIETPTNLPEFRETALACKLCVYIFAFLTGWTYYHHRDKSCNYSIKKITSIMVDYGLIVLVMAIISWNFCNYNLSFEALINEILPFSQRNKLMCFTWYIRFYILAMVLLPFIATILNKPIYKNFNSANIIVTVVGCSYILFAFSHPRLDLACLFCTTLGYLCAQYNMLEFICGQLKKIPLSIIIGLLLVISCIWVQNSPNRLLRITMPRICTPIFCCGIILLYPLLQKFRCVTVLEFLGKHSLNVWILHGIYFSSVTRKVFQPTAYAIDSPFYVILFVLGSCLLVSIALKPVQNAVKKLVLRGLADEKEERTELTPRV